MQDINFGTLIAFYLPGFILLWGLSFSVPEIAVWLTAARAATEANVASFLFATVVSLAFGLMLGAVRWAIVDTVLNLVMWAWCKGKPPTITFANLSRNEHTRQAFQGIVDNHYRYYQYYSNTLTALLLSVLAYLFTDHVVELSPFLLWSAVIVVGMLLAASYDCLWKYCSRGASATA